MKWVVYGSIEKVVVLYAGMGSNLTKVPCPCGLRVVYEIIPSSDMLTLPIWLGVFRFLDRPNAYRYTVKNFRFLDIPVDSSNFSI